jgi:hypothetical protein
VHDCDARCTMQQCAQPAGHKRVVVIGGGMVSECTIAMLAAQSSSVLNLLATSVWLFKVEAWC